MNDKGVVIIRLLCEGWHVAKIAKHLKVSPQAVAKRVRRYVMDGRIECYQSGYQKFYRKMTTQAPSSAGALANPYPLKWIDASTLLRGGEGQTLHLATNLAANGQPPAWDGGKQVASISTSAQLRQRLVPARVGGIFGMDRKPALKYNSRGHAYDKDMGYTADFGRVKASIWALYYLKGSVDECRLLARQAVLDIARAMEQKHNVKLAFLRWYEKEWIVDDKPLSGYLADGLGIGAGEAKVIGEVLVKYDDKSHPKLAQINPLHGKPEGLTDRAAKETERLFNGEFSTRTDKILTILEKMTQVVEEIKMWKELKGK